MKIVLSILLFTIMGCATVQNEAIETIISVEKTPCFGKCLSYKWVLTSDRKMECEIIERAVGKREKAITFSKSEYKKIRKELEEIPFDSYEKEYVGKRRDVSKFIVIYKGKTIKYVNSKAPEKLKNWVQAIKEKYLTTE